MLLMLQRTARKLMRSDLNNRAQKIEFITFTSQFLKRLTLIEIHLFVKYDREISCKDTSNINICEERQKILKVRRTVC